jgi:hypothetical protein
MGDRLYLFPELLETNPSSFLQTGVLSHNIPVQVDGYKLYVFIDRLDEPGFPFCVAPVPCQARSTLFYQYQFTDGPPDFATLGLDTLPSPHGEIIFLPVHRFLALSAQFRSTSVKGGNWANVFPVFNELAAYAHLDLVPQLTTAILKDHRAAEALVKAFHRHYDSPRGPRTTLGALYSEAVRLLRFFCFATDDASVVPKQSGFCFGAIRPAVSAFHAKVFPSVPLGKNCLSPGTMRQLRAFERFIEGALVRLGIDSLSLFEGVRQFQQAHGLPEGRCNEMTLNRIWALLLGPSSDPAATLADLGIALNLETHRTGEQFGDIDAAGCGEGGQRIALGLSRSVSNQKAPGSILATAQKQLLSAAKDGFDQFRSMSESAAPLDEKAKAIARFASGIQDEAARTSETAEAALRVIDGLTVMNKEVEGKLVLIRQRMGREIGRTNVLVLGLITMGILLFVQSFIRRSAS